jgi:hypothetical protein
VIPHVTNAITAKLLRRHPDPTACIEAERSALARVADGELHKHPVREVERDRTV